MHAAAEWAIISATILTDSKVQALRSTDYDLAPEGVVYCDIRSFITLNFVDVNVLFSPQSHALAALGALQN